MHYYINILTCSSWNNDPSSKLNYEETSEHYQEMRHFRQRLEQIR